MESPDVAIVSLVDQRYGFCLFDVGITAEDLCNLDQIVITKNNDYNQFGMLLNWRDEMAQFLKEIGPNESHLVETVADRIYEIALKIIVASGKESGWICLRAGLPNDKYDIPRWHMDGHYYTKGQTTQYKFALTLIGASTLFYPIPTDYIELRHLIWTNMTNRKCMNQMLDPEKAISPNRGQGAFFMGGNCRLAAVHSEPPIHENRLFLSLVPCNHNEIQSLKASVMKFYRNKSAVYD